MDKPRWISTVASAYQSTAIGYAGRGQLDKLPKGGMPTFTTSSIPPGYDNQPDEANQHLNYGCSERVGYSRFQQQNASNN